MSRLITRLFTIFILFTAVPAFAQESVPAVDLSVTISTLAKAATTGRGGPEQGTPVILNGTVLDRHVIDGEQETFSAEITLGSGEWVNSSEIVISKCIVLLNGPEYSEMLPARRSRTEKPKELSLNTEIIVYGVFLGYTETDDGPVAVVESGGVRKL